MIEEIKSMAGSLSDFGSCVSLSSLATSNEESNDENENSNTGFKTPNEKRSLRKNKRKSRQSPPAENFLKKPNIDL